MKNLLKYFWTLLLLKLGINLIRFYKVKDGSYAESVTYPSMKLNIIGKTLKVIDMPFEAEYESMMGIKKTIFILGKDIETGIIYKVLFQG